MGRAPAPGYGTPRSRRCRPEKEPRGERQNAQQDRARAARRAAAAPRARRRPGPPRAQPQLGALRRDVEGKRFAMGQSRRHHQEGGGSGLITMQQCRCCRFVIRCLALPHCCSPASAPRHPRWRPCAREGGPHTRVAVAALCWTGSATGRRHRHRQGRGVVPRRA